MKKIRNTVRVSNSLDLLGLEPNCLLMLSADKGPPDEKSLDPHIDGTCGSSQGDPGPLTVTVLVFKIQPTAMVIWRQCHRLKSHPTDWRRQGPLTEKSSDNRFLKSLSSIYLTGVLGSSGFFQGELKFSKVPGGPNICIPGGWGQTFFKGVESNC